MDSFDWLELDKGIREFGHGSVRFYLKEEEDLTELKIDTVVINNDTEEVEVTLLEW